MSKLQHKESKEEMQRQQIQKQIMNLKIFFYTMSAIICFKYIILAVYDIYKFFDSDRDIAPKYAFIISFFSAEIFIVLLMSKSI